MRFADVKKQVIHLWHTHATMSNIVLVIALVIAGGWTWGTISSMQTNLAAQRAYEEQERQLELTKLEVATLQYQQNYYNSDEYKDLSARTYLGLVSPGEKVLILPKNSTDASREVVVDTTKSTSGASSASTRSNFQQWMDFLSGSNAHDLQQ
jgi:cell division protein FtsB